MATLNDFHYSRVWTNPQDFPGLEYTKNWESSDDFPTIETDELTVRKDMQFLFDEIADYLKGEVRRFFAAVMANEDYVIWMDYDDEYQFTMGDRCIYDGSSYLCLRDCVGITPDSEDGADYWLLVASGGAVSLVTQKELLTSLTVDELYSSYGMLSDLTVNSLRTDYMRAQRYKEGDTSPIDYLAIHDEEISFWTGKVVYDETQDPPVPRTEQLHHLDTVTNTTRWFYWTDATQTQMTFLDVTGWPVTVYVYDDDYGSGNGVRPKGTFRFEEEPDGNGGIHKVPVFVLGQGTDQTKQTENGMAKIVKHTDGLELSYLTGSGKQLGVYQRDEGFLELTGLRKVTAIDFSGLDSGEFTVTMEGNVTKSYVLEYDGQGNIISISGEGLDIPVSW